MIDGKRAAEKLRKKAEYHTQRATWSGQRAGKIVVHQRHMSMAAAFYEAAQMIENMERGKSK